MDTLSGNRLGGGAFPWAATKEDSVLQAEAHSTLDAAEGSAVGVDVGATLAKIAVRGSAGELDFGFLPAAAIQAVARRLGALAPATLGVTGCGASALVEALERPQTGRFVEFEAWGRGASELLARQDVDPAAPYLLVSLGTGTSVLRVEGGKAARLGGTALGGGTVLGLGVALTGCESYEELVGLAGRGKRANVDLLVSHIYAPGEIPLPGETTAACFGNLARWLTHGDTPSQGDPSKREDLAASVMGLVGENVGLIAAGLAATTGVSRIVFGGATLRENPALVAVLMGVTAAMGHEPILLEEGGFAGAVGALVMSAG